MKWQLIFLLFFLFPIVMALEYNVGKIDDCVTDLNVKVIGALPIYVNEYNLKDCSIIQNNEWNCLCSNPIILTVPNNAINNYTFTITYTIQKVQQSSGGHSGGGSGGGIWYNYSYSGITLYNHTIEENGTNITYPYYNITNEYKTLVFNVSPQPINIIETNNTIPVIKDERTIWQKLWDILSEIFKIKLW